MLEKLNACSILPPCILVDIDGTLANCDHRRHFVDVSLNTEFEPHGLDPLTGEHDGYFDDDGNPFKKNWKSFNEQMVNDTPNDWCVEIINRFSRDLYSSDGILQEEAVKFIFITAREELFRVMTRNQILAWTNLRSYQELLMRPSKDYRPDTDIKKEIYEKHIKNKYDVLFCVDDRDCVVKLWRSLGLICLQCSEGNF